MVLVFVLSVVGEGYGFNWMIICGNLVSCVCNCMIDW